MNYLHEIEINVIKDIILYPMALGPRLGEEVDSFLTNIIGENEKPLLVQLNIRDTNPIEYLFTKKAFGNTFTKINSDSDIDIIYYVQSDYQKWNLLKGILQSTNPEYSHKGCIEKEFLSENLHIKICNGSKIDFLASLSEYEKKVLDEINSKEEIRTYDIVEVFKSEIEIHEITSTIEKLKQKKFIHSSGDKTSELLISVNKKIKNYV
jgi:hypothetical protein